MRLREARRDVRVDVDLSQNRRPAADQHHELGLGVEVAREVVPDGADVGDVLVLPCRDCSAAHAQAHGDAGVGRLTPRVRLEHELRDGAGGAGRGHRGRGADLRREHAPQSDVLAVRRGPGHRGAVRRTRGARRSVSQPQDGGADRARSRRDRVAHLYSHLVLRVRLHHDRRDRAHDGARQSARPAAVGGVLLRKLRLGLRRQGRDVRAGGGDGGARVEPGGRLRVRRHPVGGSRAQGARPAHRRGAALPWALAARERGEPAAGAARAGPPSGPLRAPRGGRAHPGARNARPRGRRASHATRRATRSTGGARGALGPAAVVSRGVDLAPGMRILALEEVTFWYPATATPALESVSLEVGSGEVVALVGRGGAGASTLLLIAAGLAPRVTGGRLAGSVTRGARAGIVLPTPWTQLSGMAFTVWDEVAFGPANLGWPEHEITRHVDRALERLEITPLASRDPVTLSGGELQRVIVAGILAMDPDLVLLDEPTAELDPEGARAVWRLVRSLAGEGKAVILATSDVDALPGVADRIIWLDQGSVRALGEPSLLAEDAMCEAGRGTTVAGWGRAAGLGAAYPRRAG